MNDNKILEKLERRLSDIDKHCTTLPSIIREFVAIKNYKSYAKRPDYLTIYQILLDTEKSIERYLSTLKKQLRYLREK